jgi:hypothetical protein
MNMKSKFRLFYNSYFTVQIIRPIASLVYKSKGPVLANKTKVTVISFRAIAVYYRSLLILTGLGYTPSGFRLIGYFISQIKLLKRFSGVINTVKYLKTCSVMIQQSLAGHIEKDLSMIAGVRPSRSKNGLPAVIPSVIRNHMVSDKFVPFVRFILSVFSLFRDIPFPKDTIKVSSITDPYTGSPNIIPSLGKYLVPFCRGLWLRSPDHHFGVLTPKGWFLRGYKPKVFTNLDSAPFPIWKSSPQTGSVLKGFPTFSTHPRALHASAWALELAGMKSTLLRFADLISAKSVRSLFEQALRVPILEQDRVSLAKIGKLGMVKEAAGKVRVFAMVDA